jgi:rubrerythrin
VTEQLSEPISTLGAVSASVALPTLQHLELLCTECGYGAIASQPPNRCPTCGGLDSDFDEWRRFSSRTGVPDG